MARRAVRVRRDFYTCLHTSECARLSLGEDSEFMPTNLAIDDRLIE